MTNWLIATLFLSCIGGFFMLFRKIAILPPDLRESPSEHYTNFAADFLVTLKLNVEKFIHSSYIKSRLYCDELIISIISRLHKIGSWIAEESLKLHDFVQGRRILKNSGNTSLFIRNMDKGSRTNGRRI